MSKCLKLSFHSWDEQVAGQSQTPAFTKSGSTKVAGQHFGIPILTFRFNEDPAFFCAWPHTIHRGGFIHCLSFSVRSVHRHHGFDVTIRPARQEPAGAPAALLCPLATRCLGLSRRGADILSRTAPKPVRILQASCDRSSAGPCILGAAAGAASADGARPRRCGPAAGLGEEPDAAPGAPRRARPARQGHGCGTKGQGSHSRATHDCQVCGQSTAERNDSR